MKLIAALVGASLIVGCKAKSHIKVDCDWQVLLSMLADATALTYQAPALNPWHMERLIKNCIAAVELEHISTSVRLRISSCTRNKSNWIVDRTTPFFWKCEENQGCCHTVNQAMELSC
jgi:hypothetical protein